MRVIESTEIQEKIQEMIHYTALLKEDISNFKSEVNNIHEVIDGLKICLNTTGGIDRISNINNITFNTDVLDKVVDEVLNIQVSYHKEKKYLS